MSGNGPVGAVMAKGQATSLLLVVSALLGTTIILTDRNLWQYQPSHAYGLIAFIIIDLGAAGLVLAKGSRRTIVVAGAWGGLQALIMMSDIITGPTSINLPPDQFAIYLFGLGYYDNMHIAFLFPLLFVVNIIVLLSALLGRRQATEHLSFGASQIK
jgi:hypothetical protein